MPDPPARQPSLLTRLSESAEFGRFTKWVLLASIVGFCGGLAGWVFHWAVRLLTWLLFRLPTGLTTEGAAGIGGRWWLVLLLPALGGFLVGKLVELYAAEAEGHGTEAVVRSFHRMKGMVRGRVVPLKALTAALSIGSGGSAGTEGPIAQVGAGIGSSLAQRLGLSDRDRRLFLLTGASAGIGAMFCSPLGGALFAPEVLYKKPEFEGEAIVPCIVSSTFGYATYTALTGQKRVVDISPDVLERLEFQPSHLLVYLLLGALCALVGWAYTQVFYRAQRGFDALKQPLGAWRPALGGLLLGALALALIPATGEHGVLFGGYELMAAAIGGTLSVSVLLWLIPAKIVATTLTVASGGSGGVFAPALAIGALLGALVGEYANTLLPTLALVPGAVALVCMGGFFAGVARVPIAAVVMVTEMTGGYDLLAPLLLVAALHLMLSSGRTIYRAQVGGPIDSPAHIGDFVVDVLQSVKVRDCLEEIRAPRLIHEDITLRGAMRIVSDSHETHFPVVDDDERLVGIFSLGDLRRVFLEDVIEDVIIVSDFMREQVVTVRLDDSLHDVQRLMTRRGVSAVPVVDTEDSRKVVALLERNRVGRAYSEKLAQLKGLA